MNNQDLVLPIDDAHLTALDLSTHILEYANSYRVISSQGEFMGRQRMRYVVLLLMFDEMGKLMELMKDCERAVTEKDPQVKIEGFFDRTSRKEQSFENILKEIGKSEMLVSLFKRVMGRSPSSVDFESFKQQFTKGSNELDSKMRKVMFYDINGRSDHQGELPDDRIMDMFFEAIVINAEGAREFIQEWVRAKELDISYRLKASKVTNGVVSMKLWSKEPIAKEQRNFKT